MSRRKRILQSLSGGSVPAPTDYELYMRWDDNVNDATGNHTPSLIGGGITYRTGLYGVGKCADAGIGTQVSIPDHNNLSFNSNQPHSWTFAYRPDVIRTNNWLVTKRSGGSQREYDIFAGGGNKMVYLIRDASNNRIIITCSTALVVGVTNHYGFGWDGTDENGLVCFINGVKDTGATLNKVGAFTSTFNGTGNITILSLEGGNGLDGRLDYFGMARRLFSDAEFTATYNANSSGIDGV